MLRKCTRVLVLLALLSAALGCAPSDQTGLSGEAGEFAGGESSSAYAQGQDERAQTYDQGEGDTTVSEPETNIIVDDPSVTVVPEAPMPPATPPSGPGPWIAGEGSGPPNADDSDEIGASERAEPKAADVPTWPVYTDQTYRFRIAYPPYYVIETLDAAAFAGFEPVPLYAVSFQDEEVAVSDTAHLAVPAFSIRVYENRAQQPLEAWLASAGLVGASQYTEPYEGSHESGISVLSRRYIAPGWFVYVAGDGLVYQLTPMGPAGEFMLDTFRIGD